MLEREDIADANDFGDMEVGRAELAEPALHIPQQANCARAEATLPPDCLECAFGLCCDRSGPVDDGSCFEQRR